MKYCMRYFSGSRHLKDADEIMLKYPNKTSKIIEYVQKYKPEQRIILDITELDGGITYSQDIFKAVKEVHENFALMITIQQKLGVPALQELGIDFFFVETVDTWDKLNSFINYGVSDVYIGSDFGFELAAAGPFCHERGVKVRVYPNVAQTSSKIDNLETMSYFFIRPEDTMFYNLIVDTYEFFGSVEKQDVLYDIYTKGKWLGNLNDLILGLKRDINNTVIANCFGALRTGCEKRCGHGKNICNICTRFLNIDRIIKEANSIDNEDKVNETTM